MSDTHGASEPSVKPNEGARGPAARKVESESRNFEPASGAATATNLEARHIAPAASPPEVMDFWRDAFSPIFNAQMEASRWLDQVWRQTTGFGALPALHTGRPFGSFGVASMLGMPAADMRETDGAYELSVELPGLARDDIDLKLERDVIRICGHKVEEKEEGRSDYRVSERRYGRFERSFPIPQDADRANISAAYADGVLKITLPKAAEARTEAKRIEIR